MQRAFTVYTGFANRQEAREFAKSVTDNLQGKASVADSLEQLGDIPLGRTAFPVVIVQGNPRDLEQEVSFHNTVRAPTHSGNAGQYNGPKPL
jgi:hypothetical protein